MAPQSTWLTVLWLLPSLAVFLSVLTLDWRERRLLSLLAIAAGVASAFLGLAQLVQGPTSPLRFFSITNASSPVGFFANVNHFAALLYSTILLTAAWLTTGLSTLRPARWKSPDVIDAASVTVSIAASVALVTLFAVELTTRSRGGTILTMAALFGALTLSGSPLQYLRNRAIVAVLIGLMVVMVFMGKSALFDALDRFAVDPLTDVRTVFARTTFEAAQALMPIGAGLGTFVPVFALFEKPRDVEAYAGDYANHAHNDLLELLLETGVAGLLLLGLFLYWLARRAFQMWGASNPGPLAIDKSLARAAILVIAMLLCHSLVDYPLRTGAMMAIAAFACALLINPAIPAAVAESVEMPIDARRLWRRSRAEPAHTGARRRYWPSVQRSDQ
ncbi:O-antigen ligase family protein [Methylocystis sp. H62]|nr:O-antigen ligase family protein [Methylocystis sp. H62]